jgi:type IV secretory pathway VirB4 component
MIELGLPRIPGQGLCAIELKDLWQHTYVIGKTGTGKSTLLLNLALEVINQDSACIFIEPKGSVISALNRLVDKDRLINISFDNPLTINPLRKKGYHINDIISEFIEVMDILISLTSPNVESTVLMKEIITEAVLCFSEEQRDLEYLYHFLLDEKFRDKHFKGRRPAYWEAFDGRDPVNRGLANREKIDSAKRVASRLASFINDPRMKKIVCGENQLDIKNIVNHGKVLLVDTSRMSFDKRIYVSALITHYVKSYVEFGRQKDRSLIVFADEFQTSISPLFSHLLALSREYKVGFVLAHQDFKQISEKVLGAVLGNVNQIITFNCGYEEANRMKNEYGHSLKANDFLNLKPFEALVRIKSNVHKIACFPPPAIPEAEEETAISFLRQGWFSA